MSTGISRGETMPIVRVRWVDAVSAWSNPWNSLAEIVEELADATIDTAGYLVEDHGTPFVVVAASVTRWGTKFAYGGIVAIPVDMVSTIKVLEDHPPAADL